MIDRRRFLLSIGAAAAASLAPRFLFAGGEAQDVAFALTAKRGSTRFFDNPQIVTNIW